MNKNKKTMLLIVGALLVISVITGISYALWNVTRTQADTNLVTAGCFDIEFVDGDAISLENQFPVSDSKGLTSTPYTITVKNTCTTDAKVNIKLLTLNETTINTDFMKISLQGDIAEPISLISNLDEITDASIEAKSVQLLSSSFLEAGTEQTYAVRLWVTETATKTDTEYKTYSGKIEIDAFASKAYADASGAETPDLDNGLIPVVYDSYAESWKIADRNSRWYDYENGVWANAVTVKESVRANYTSAPAGTKVPMDDINTMWVWIPRYSYTIKSENGKYYSGKITGDITYCKDIENPTPQTHPECYDYSMDEENRQKFITNLAVEWYMNEETAELVYNIAIEEGYVYGEYMSLDEFVSITDTTYTATFNENYIVGYSDANPGQIDVKFVSTETKENGTAQYIGDTATGWYTHPAFTFGDQELSGIWFAKFEMSAASNSVCADREDFDDCDEDIGGEIKPNTKAWQVSSLAKLWYAIHNNMNENNGKNTYGIEKSDVHLMKNMDWGAVAYLSQSKYGKNGNDGYIGLEKEVYSNDSMYSGRSNGGVFDYPYDVSGLYTYEGRACKSILCLSEPIINKKEGYGASTTGNIYGVYDMAAGRGEYVMAFMENESKTSYLVQESGFNGCVDADCSEIKTDGYEIPAEKYFDVYKYWRDGNANGIPTATSLKGDAAAETFGWYEDASMYIDADSPFIYRGGWFNDTMMGIFYAEAWDGTDAISRPVLTKGVAR